MSKFLVCGPHPDACGETVEEGRRSKNEETVKEEETVEEERVEKWETVVGIWQPLNLNS